MAKYVRCVLSDSVSGPTQPSIRASQHPASCRAAHLSLHLHVSGGVPRQRSANSVVVMTSKSYLRTPCDVGTCRRMTLNVILTRPQRPWHATPHLAQITCTHAPSLEAQARRRGGLDDVTTILSFYRAGQACVDKIWRPELKDAVVPVDPAALATSCCAAAPTNSATD